MVKSLLFLLGLMPCVLQAQNLEELKSLPMFERAVALTKHFESWHGPEAGDYVGYGHRVLPGEGLSHDLTEEEADSLLRADLLARCAIFRRFGGGQPPFGHALLPGRTFQAVRLREISQKQVGPEAGTGRQGHLPGICFLPLLERQSRPFDREAEGSGV